MYKLLVLQQVLMKNDIRRLSYAGINMLNFNSFQFTSGKDGKFLVHKTKLIFQLMYNNYNRAK